MANDPNKPAPQRSAEDHDFIRLMDSVKGTRLDPARASSLRTKRSARWVDQAAAAAPKPTPAAVAQAEENDLDALLATADSSERVFVKKSATPRAPAAVSAGTAATPSPAPSAASGSTTYTSRLDYAGRPRQAATTQTSAAAGKNRVDYSDEQKKIIACQAKNVVADAFAGCGKTTTAVGFCEARPRDRILYMVLNAANAAEARERFPANVDAKTTHSLAWNSDGMKRHVGARLDRRWRAMTLMQQFSISNAAEAYHAQQVLQAFFGSTDREIGERHVDTLRAQKNLSHGLAMRAVDRARRVWSEICEPSGTCSIPDDAYLKMYALKVPQLPYDQIILDEAQDANPVTAQIVGAQVKPRLLCIGDRHQSIYQFRGSVNAMEKFGQNAERFHITQTYRFGPRIAEVANTILGDLKGETHRIKGMAADPTGPATGRTTHLSRTNAQLFALAAGRRGEGVYWVAKEGPGGYTPGRDGPDNYRLGILQDVYHLFSGDNSSIKDKTLRDIGSFEDYKHYAENGSDGEARIMVKLIESHGHDTPDLIEDIRNNAARSEKDADVLLTTAHKSKGLEWDRVRLCEDFEFLADLEAELANEPNPKVPVQDVNLLYVAVTRARKHIELNEETTQWLADLPRHREERALNITRQEHQRSR